MGNKKSNIIFKKELWYNRDKSTTNYGSLSYDKANIIISDNKSILYDTVLKDHIHVSDDTRNTLFAAIEPGEQKKVRITITIVDE